MAAEKLTAIAAARYQALLQNNNIASVCVEADRLGYKNLGDC
ncbi:MAG: hypothetical protein AAFY11_02855 [Cyanobacteria bacterium J06641_5]